MRDVKTDRGADTESEAIDSSVVKHKEVVELSVWLNSWTSACSDMWLWSDHVQMTAFEKINPSKRLCRFTERQKKERSATEFSHEIIRPLIILIVLTLRCNRWHIVRNICGRG